MPNRVIVRGQVYCSQVMAAFCHDVSPRHVRTLLHKYGHLEYLGKPKKRETPASAKPVTIHGLSFKSLTEAANALGISRKTIYNAGKRNSSSQTILAAAMGYKRELELQQQKELQHESG